MPEYVFIFHTWPFARSSADTKTSRSFHPSYLSHSLHSARRVVNKLTFPFCIEFSTKTSWYYMKCVKVNIERPEQIKINLSENVHMFYVWEIMLQLSWLEASLPLNILPLENLTFVLAICKHSFWDALWDRLLFKLEIDFFGGNL